MINIYYKDASGNNIALENHSVTTTGRKWELFEYVLNPDYLAEPSVSSVLIELSGDGDGEIWLDDWAFMPEEAHLTSYTYDKYQNVTSVRQNDNQVIEYTYDGFNRVIAATNYKKVLVEATS